MKGSLGRLVVGGSALVAIGGSGVPALADEPTVQATLLMSVSVGDRSLRPGGSTRASIRILAGRGVLENVSVSVRVSGAGSASGACVGGCSLGSVGTGGTSTGVQVSIPSSVREPSTVVLNVTADAANTPGQTRGVVLTVTPPDPPRATPTPKPSKTPEKAKPTPRGGGGGGGGGDHRGRSDDAPDVPSTPNGFPAPPLEDVPTPSIAFPQADGPVPTVAPPLATPQRVVLRSGESAAPPTIFGRLAGTQAAWLAIQLVAFGLLLTQLRLTRRLDLVTPTRGTHRHPRKGLHSR